MARGSAVALITWTASLCGVVAGLETLLACTRFCSHGVAWHLAPPPAWPCPRGRGGRHVLRLRGGGDDLAYEYEREERDKDLRVLARSLRRAADQGDLYALRRALRLGAQVNQVDCSGFTALHLAAEKGHEDVVNELLQQGASVDQREHISGWTPLHAAAYAARSKVLPILVNHGADVESRDHAGATPMILACRSGSVSAVRTLHQLNASLWATQPAPFIEHLQFLAEPPRASVMRRCVCNGTDVRSALQSNGELTLEEREAVLQCLQQLSLQELSLQEPESVHRQQGQQEGKGGPNVGGLSSSGNSVGEGGDVDFVKRSSPIEDQKRREGPDGSKDGGKATVPDVLGGSSPRG